MMMQIPIDIAPTRTASATLCSCTISFHRWYGVTRSITTNAITKIRMPSNVNTIALIRLANGIRLISFASSVVVIAAVNRAVGTGIIAHRARNIVQLIHGVEAPTAVLRKSDGGNNQQAINQVDRAEHQSSSSEPLLTLKIGLGGWSLSDQRERSKLMERQVINTG